MKDFGDFVEVLHKEKVWAKTLELRRNEFLTQEGAINRNIYFIVDGSVRVFTAREAEEHTIRFGYKQSIISALDSFITGKATEFNIQALKKTTLKWVSREKLMKMINSNVAYLKQWNQVLEWLVLQQIERENDLLTSSPKERYQRVLNRSPEVFQEIPAKYIASYLRMAPETLSRFKKS